MTYEEAMTFVEDSNQYGSVLGLDSMRSLLDGLGNPQNQLKFVHIAGTNGKGSTAAYIATIMAAAGYHVGRYISPSVLEYREKIQISFRQNLVKDGNPVTTRYISETGIANCINEIKRVCEHMVEAEMPHPTLFEIETAMAMMYFIQENCNLVVLEVGLGGRLDATNVINTTECAVLTSISMDHMHILGNTLELIATEKAGIIKTGIQVVSYEQKTEANKVIEAVSKQNGANLNVADFNKLMIEVQGLDGTIFSYDDLSKVRIQLLGENQVKNAVVSILAVKALQKIGYIISEDDIRTGLYHTKWRGRFEIIKSNPLFLVDGAHNEDAAISLAKNIKTYFANKRVIFVVGVLKDKDYDAVLRHTGCLAEKIITITPNNSRGLKSDILAKTASKYCSQVIDAVKVSEAIKLAYEAISEDNVIIAFGSLSYLKEVYEELKCMGGNYGS